MSLVHHLTRAAALLLLAATAHAQAPSASQFTLAQRKATGDGYDPHNWTWTNSTLLYRDGSGVVGPVGIGSGLSISGGNLVSTATGTVTSVALSGGTTGLTVSGSPITTSGTITLEGTLAIANGGTGATSASAARTSLGLAIGTNVQAYREELVNYGIKGTTVASATNLSLGTANGDFIDISGTTTIVSLGTCQAGLVRTVRFEDALILTHNATALILPTGANITTAAGDTAVLRSLGSGNWVCISYHRKSGEALVGDGGGGDPITDDDVAYIRADGNDTTGDGTPSAPWLTAQKAAVTEGYTYLDIGVVDAGNIVWTGTTARTLRIRGRGPGSVIGTISTEGGNITVIDTGVQSVWVTTIDSAAASTGEGVDGGAISLANVKAATLASTGSASTDMGVNAGAAGVVTLTGACLITDVVTTGGENSGGGNSGNGAYVNVEGPSVINTSITMTGGAGGTPGTDGTLVVSGGARAPTPTPDTVTVNGAVISGQWYDNTYPNLPFDGSTGSNDNRLLRANGAGGRSIQDSPVTVDDSGNFTGVGTVNGHNVKTVEFIVPCSDLTSNLTAGTTRGFFAMPHGFTLTGVRAKVLTAPTGSTIIVDINEAGSTVLGTKLSIDAGETSSTTAASAATITDSAIADDASVTIDIDQVGSSTAGVGLVVTLYGTRS